MVKKVENFGPEFNTQRFMHVRSLNDGKIRVAEPRTSDHIPAQIAKARHGHEYPGIEPAICGAEDCDWSGHVWP